MSQAYASHQMTRPFHFPFEVINFIPFHTIINDLVQFSAPTVIQVLGNLFLLTPLCFFILLFKMASNRKTVIIAFYFSLSIELLQLIKALIFSQYTWGLGRAADIDDVILNTLSAFIALLLYKGYETIRYKMRNSFKNLREEVSNK
ncbi:VanZ family protein [Sporolactobacillus kofuensis]|nr:VanZ family protein [Sporolactobacillus kofuensis]